MAGRPLLAHDAIVVGVGVPRVLRVDAAVVRPIAVRLDCSARAVPGVGVLAGRRRPPRRRWPRSRRGRRGHLGRGGARRCGRRHHRLRGRGCRADGRRVTRAVAWLGQMSDKSDEQTARAAGQHDGDDGYGRQPFPAVRAGGGVRHCNSVATKRHLPGTGRSAPAEPVIRTRHDRAVRLSLVSANAGRLEDRAPMAACGVHHHGVNPPRSMIIIIRGMRWPARWLPPPRLPPVTVRRGSGPTPDQAPPRSGPRCRARG